jgi:hypothetical protein
MEPLITRKSGGQPHNQNARKHGLYSKFLSKDQKRRLKLAAGIDGLDQEIAILRLKFMDLLATEGQNARLINESAETLARLYNIKYSHGRNDISKLKEAVASVLEDFSIPHPPDSNPGVLSRTSSDSTKDK